MISVAMNVGFGESCADRIIDSHKLATVNRRVAIRASVSSGCKGLRRHFRVAEGAQLPPRASASRRRFGGHFVLPRTEAEKPAKSTAGIPPNEMKRFAPRS